MFPNIKPFRKLLLQSPLKNRYPKEIELNGNNLNLENLSILAAGNHKIKICPTSIEKMNASRRVVNSIIRENNPVYGFNTGFGQFSNICIQNENLEQLQYNLIRSHATGAGDLLNLDQTRRTTILRLNTLIRGYSGISIDTVITLIKIINANIVAYMPCQGTVGASGDLIPLAHIAMGIIGEGLLYNPNTGKYEDAKKVLEEHHIEPAILKPKEGLSLINGTQFMTGIGSVALEKSLNLVRAVNAISGLSFTALEGNPNEFDGRIGEIRPHPGQIAVAEIMSKLVPIGSILVNPHDVQSPYSLRCIPQVHGPTLEMLLHIKEILEREFNSTTDNPLIFEYGTPRIISNGNFHGEYIAKALDVLAIYTHELGNISYPRIMRLLNKAKNKDLRTFLTYEEGLSSGMMTYENLAAALVSENKVHCTPASVDSISTCADKEDHVSMGGYAARKAVTVSDNVGKILTVELMAATKAIYMRKEEEVDFTIPPYLRKLYEKVIAISPPFIKDRYSKPEYDKIYEFIMSGQLWDEVLSQFDVDAEEGEISKEKNTFVPKINNNNEIYKNKMEGREPKEVKEVAKEARNSNDKKSDSLGKEIKISPIPMNEQGHLIYTKERNNQTQIGQLPNLFIKSENSISAKDISEHLKAKKNDNEKVFAILDLSQDDIGSRANFGKGHSSPNYSIIPFLEKLSNHPVNKLNINYINSILLLGSLDLSDLISQCENLDVNVKENRDILINSVGEVDRRTQQVCDKILQSGSQIICLNGDNNNTFSLIASVEKAFKKKVVLIYLDLHSDCRDTNDGPHSGTWVTQAYENGLVEKAFLVGFSELHNNEACVNNLLKNNVEFVNYTAQKIQSGLTSIKSSVEEIVNIVKYNHIGHPVVLCIDGDTVCGLPASAGNTVVGFPHFEVYPMIYKLSNELDVKAYHIAELKPSLDVSKSSAVGEFLMQATYLFLKGSLDSKKN